MKFRKIVNLANKISVRVVRSWLHNTDFGDDDGCISNLSLQLINNRI